MTRAAHQARGALRMSLAAMQAMLLVGLTAVGTTAHAGAFIGSDAFFKENTITHPRGFTGGGGPVNVKVCIKPGSPNAAAMQAPMANIVQTWNGKQATTGNVLSGTIPGGKLDFESVVLHEVGHCLGLAHSNAASESGLSGNASDATRAGVGLVNFALDINAGTDGVHGTTDDVRGDDVNVHWYVKACPAGSPAGCSQNNPFFMPEPVDSTTMSRALSDLPAGHTFAANASRQVAAALGQGNTEAVMNQGTSANEEQRMLAADDVATLRLAESGYDMIAGTGDDSETVLVDGGISSASDCDINVEFDPAFTGFASCSVVSSLLPPPAPRDHFALTLSNIRINPSFNFHFSEPASASDLALQIISTDEVVEVGQAFTWTYAVSNDGEATADDVQMVIDLPVSFTILEVTPTIGSCSVLGAQITCDIGTLPPAATASVSLLADAMPMAVGPLDTVATVSTPTVDDDLANNSMTTTTHVAAFQRVPASIAPVALDGFTVTQQTVHVTSVSGATVNWTSFESTDGCATATDVPWLSSNPTTTILAPLTSVPVVITIDPELFDGSALAQLCIVNADATVQTLGITIEAFELFPSNVIRTVIPNIAP